MPSMATASKNGGARTQLSGGKDALAPPPLFDLFFLWLGWLFLLSFPILDLSHTAVIIYECVCAALCAYAPLQDASLDNLFHALLLSKPKKRNLQYDSCIPHHTK